MSFLKQDKIPIAKWEPLNLNLHNNFFKLNKNSVKFKNEMHFNFYDCFKNFKDLKINKESGLVLSDMYKDSDIFNKNKKISTKIFSENNYIETALYLFDNALLVVNDVEEQNGEVIEQQPRIVNRDPNLFEQKDVLTIIFLDEETLKIKTHSNLFLTEEDEIIKFAPAKIDEDLNKFNYIKSDNKLFIFRYQTDFIYPLTFYIDGFEIKLKFQEYYIHSKYSWFPGYFEFKLVLPTLNSLNENNSFLTQNGPVTYDLIETNNFYYKPVQDSKEYFNNYLIHFPLSKNESFTDVVNLKNFHTSTYEYSNAHSVRLDLPSGTNRIYDRIHSGSNQINGYENIFLNYRTNTENFIFYPDEITKFTMSPYAGYMHIQNSGLIEDGAFYGESPETSDNVLVENVVSRDQPTPELITSSKQSKNYTLLCSWLYKDPEENFPMWMDRYYNNATYSASEALSGKVLDLNRYEEGIPYYDVESSLELQPAGHYSYKRIGKKFLNTALSKSKNLKNKILEAKTWDLDIIKDLTENKNDGIFYDKNKNITKNKNFYNLNGNNHLIFPSNNLTKANNQLNVGIWLYSEDWSYLQGYQIFGNYYDGGIGLINESAAVAPLLTIADANSGFIGHFNFKFKQTSPFVALKLPTNQITNNSKGVIGNLITIRMPDYSYWVFDCYNLMAFKYDANNSLIIKISSENNILDIEYISQIEIDSLLNLYLYDDLNKKIIILNQEGKFLETIQISDENVKGFQINSADEIIYSTGYKCIIDNNDKMWEAKGVNLYKSKHIHSSLGPIHALTCDYLNNIWILHGDDLLTVINADTNNVVNGLQGLHVFNRENVVTKECSQQFYNSNRNRFINFIRLPQMSRSIYKECGKKELLDLAVIIDGDTNLLSLVDLNLNQYYKIKLDDFNLYGKGARIYADGDFTNYQYQRKYANNLSEKNISWISKLNSPGGYNPYILKLKYDTSKLSKGWHYFNLNVNCIEGFAQFFIDAVKVDEVSFETNKFFIEYKYKSPLLVGATTIRDRTLNDVIGLEDDYKFIGKIAGLEIYNKSLDYDYIKTTYLAFDLSKNIENLNWNVLTGSRNFLEEITGWLKFKVPGIKSKYFNINLQNLNIKDTETRNNLVQNITDIVNNLAPVHTKLHKIIWE